MDKSETYIKICEKAEEIQRDWKPKCGDIIQWSPNTTPIILDDKTLDSPNIIWLPRQDQLQEMIGETPYYNIKNAMYSIIDDFHNFAFDPNFKEFIPTTMEQLWLAFVMKIKHNKVWNGENWIEIK